MKEDRQICIEAGANDYMTKPLDAERLLGMLRLWLASHKALPEGVTIEQESDEG